jgi:transcriptional regulator with XRE-family HTH domain
MTVAQSIIAQPSGGHFVRSEKGFDIVKKGAHAAPCKCDIAHLSSVFCRDYAVRAKLADDSPMTDFDIDIFRANLTRLMDMHGIKRKPLAIAAGLGETAIRDIFETKRNDVRVGTVLRLADYFGVSIDEMVGHAPDGAGDLFDALASLPTSARRQAGALICAFAESHPDYRAPKATENAGLLKKV